MMPEKDPKLKELAEWAAIGIVYDVREWCKKNNCDFELPDNIRDEINALPTAESYDDLEHKLLDMRDSCKKHEGSMLQELGMRAGGYLFAIQSKRPKQEPPEQEPPRIGRHRL